MMVLCNGPNFRPGSNFEGGGGGGDQLSDQGSIEGMERVAEPKSREEPLCFTATEHEAVPTLDTVSEDVIEMFEI